MKILVLNCGSSSIKYQLLNIENETVLVSGAIERIGLDNSIVSAKDSHGNRHESTMQIVDHKAAIDKVLNALVGELKIIANINEIDAVGHRVVHGGELFSGSVLLTDEVIAQLHNCADLAPLHNPANIQGIEAIKHILPNVPQCGVFDTAFHQTMPPKAYQYAIPYKYYEQYKVRRYGFHGSSHRFVSQQAYDRLGLDKSNSKIISVHLGNGASICAIHNGESIDTSMGFTPLEGLVMGTRSGNLDIGAVLYMMRKENLDVDAVDRILNKESGLLGFSQNSSDMRDVLKAANTNGCSRSHTVLEMYAYSVKKYIGSYAAAMNGVDLIIFTGGIGENAYLVRANILKEMEYLGIVVDEKANETTRGIFGVITSKKAKTAVAVIPTNEELVIARDTFAIVKSL